MHISNNPNSPLPAHAVGREPHPTRPRFDSSQSDRPAAETAQPAPPSPPALEEDASRALQKLRAAYRAVVDHIPQQIERWLPDGTRVFANQAALQAAGSAAANLDAQPIGRMLDAQQRCRVQEALRQLTPENPRVTYELHGRDSQGTEVLVRWSDFGLFDRQGRLEEIQSLGEQVGAPAWVSAASPRAAAFRDRLERLTTRERQVMDLVAEGKANKVIARHLQLSVKTVEKHRSSMMRKLKVQSVAELVRGAVAVENGCSSDGIPVS